MPFLIETIRKGNTFYFSDLCVPWTQSVYDAHRFSDRKSAEKDLSSIKSETKLFVVEHTFEMTNK